LAAVSITEATQAEALPGKPSAHHKQKVFNNLSSLNWAGYQAGSIADLDYVTADFIVPSITCPGSGDHHVSIWDGVGQGTDADPLYQAGVRFECNSGTESSYVWWEVYTPSGGAGAAEQDFPNRTVSAGDKILIQTLPRFGSSTNVRMQVKDFGSNLANSSPNWTSSHDYTTDSPPSPDTTECIAERPTIAGSYADLLDFDTITFSTATSGSFNKTCDVTANNTDHVISSSSSSLNHGYAGSAIDMLNGSSSTLASTSGPSSSGEFDVTWVAGN
jgi:hypothetical protein